MAGETCEVCGRPRRKPCDPDDSRTCCGFYWANQRPTEFCLDMALAREKARADTAEKKLAELRGSCKCCSTAAEHKLRSELGAARSEIVTLQHATLKADARRDEAEKRADAADESARMMSDRLTRLVALDKLLSGGRSEDDPYPTYGELADSLYEAARVHDSTPLPGAVIHELKTWPAYFEASARGLKTFEVRKDDRGFAVGHWLKLREYDVANGTYSGRELLREVTYILPGGIPGGRAEAIVDGYVILGLRLPSLALSVNPEAALPDVRTAGRIDVLHRP